MRQYRAHRPSLHLLGWLFAAVWMAGAASTCRAGQPAEDTLRMNQPGDPSAAVLIDDFQMPDSASALSTRWRRVTDEVMGGVSQAEHGIEDLAGERSLRLIGQVSLDNNGGFIQVALPLTEGEAPLDASTYDGIRLRVRGHGAGYYVHLRTLATALPWQYYQAPLAAGSERRTVDIPFRAFQPQALKVPLEPSRLTRVAIAAAKRIFRADIAIARIEFYREERQRGTAGR